MEQLPEKLAERYARQIADPRIGPDGQRRLAGAGALIVGVGGLGCAVSQLLARAGVGLLRLVDDDVVSLTDLHRQVLFDEADVAAAAPKVLAAARRIARINRQVRVQPVAARFGPANAEALAEGVDVILDGCDNFATRFVINDLAVRDGLPWVFAGVAGAEAQTMTIVPGRTPCLRCLYEPPGPEGEPAPPAGAVLGPAVAAIAAVEAMEAIKILAGRAEDGSRDLLKVDLWRLSVQRIHAAEACAEAGCPCCRDRRFEFLYPPA